MNLLMDSHTVLWFGSDNPKLSPVAIDLIEDSRNQIFVSIASLWEIAIKISLGKLQIEQPLGEYVKTHLFSNDIQILPISQSHIMQVIMMPFHHKDPFDRMIVAQSLVENIPIIGIDAKFDAYGIRRFW